jgi:hypothetical protein
MLATLKGDDLPVFIGLAWSALTSRDLSSISEHGVDRGAGVLVGTTRTALTIDQLAAHYSASTTTCGDFDHAFRPYSILITLTECTPNETLIGERVTRLL